MFQDRRVGAEIDPRHDAVEDREVKRDTGEPAVKPCGPGPPVDEDGESGLGCAVEHRRHRGPPFDPRRGPLCSGRVITDPCSSCHGATPTGTGKHASTGKEIKPMAPAFNDQRFADVAKTEKWFRRNCNDVLGRECTAAEKADVLSWLLTLKP